jgi:hypothetical protein
VTTEALYFRKSELQAFVAVMGVTKSPFEQRTLWIDFGRREVLASDRSCILALEIDGEKTAPNPQQITVAELKQAVKDSAAADWIVMEPIDAGVQITVVEGKTTVTKMVKGEPKEKKVSLDWTEVSVTPKEGTSSQDVPQPVDLMWSHDLLRDALGPQREPGPAVGQFMWKGAYVALVNKVVKAADKNAVAMLMPPTPDGPLEITVKGPRGQWRVQLWPLRVPALSDDSSRG